MNFDLCKNCRNAEICRIYDLLKANIHIAEIDIQRCKQFKSTEVGDNAITDSINQPLLAPRPARQYDNFKDLSKQAKEETKKRKPVVSILKEEESTTEALTICKTCQGTTYVSDIVNCNKCGTETCSNCRTEVVEKNQKLCDKCWSEE